tara:strand:- start:439 stop:699 length:261 start_codon:yes stop_codon:yes gene_type:complete
MWKRLKRLWLREQVTAAPQPAKQQRRPYLQTELAFICKMYEDGVPVGEIAERFNRAAPNIYAKMSAMGVRRPKASWSRARRMQSGR